jgi:cytochrome c
MDSLTRGVVVRGLTIVLTIGVVAPGLAAESPPTAFNNNCRTCHSVKEGDNRLGPSLHNIHGAKAGSSSAYGGYSQGLKSSGVVWDDATLDKFIENPDQVVPNNNMKPFKGISDPAVRKQIIDFLKSQTLPRNSDKEADLA